MQMSSDISCFLKVPTGPANIKQSRIPTKAHHPVTKHVVTNVVDFNYKMPYPGKEAYHFPSGPSQVSPCMSSFWRAQPIRQGKIRDEVDHDEKPEETEI